jgi:hypothetical protein
MPRQFIGAFQSFLEQRHLPQGDFVTEKIPEQMRDHQFLSERLIVEEGRALGRRANSIQIPFQSPRNLVVGIPVRSALTVRDPVTADAAQQYLDVYYFHGEEGQQIQIDLTSTDFDPFLILDSPRGERLMLDDDSGDDWNAQTILTLPESGDYSIGVTSYLQSVGTYELRVTEVP